MKKEKLKSCAHCGQVIAKKAKVCPHCGGKNSKPIYKRVWFIVLIFMLVAGVISSFGNSNSDVNKDNPITMVEINTMTDQEIIKWCQENNIKYDLDSKYSDSISEGEIVSQSVKTGDVIYEGETLRVVFSLGEEPSEEYKNALEQAKTYSEFMHLSKQAIYDQLTSDYGGKFEKDAAQYAIDHLKADWNQNALESAESYSDTLHMSKKAIYDQLISEYGGQFTKEQAQYAIDNIEVDWKDNALKSAKSYRDNLNMSKQAIYDQLISQYADKFTKDEAQYAIDHMDD